MKDKKYRPLSEKVEDCKKPEVLKINSFVEKYLDDISFVWPTTIECSYTFWLEEGQRLNYKLYVCDKRGCPIGAVGEIDFYPKRNIVKVNSSHESVLTLEENYRQDLEKKLQDFLDEENNKGVKNE